MTFRTAVTTVVFPPTAASSQYRDEEKNTTYGCNTLLIKHYCIPRGCRGGGMPFHCRTNQSLYTQNQTDNSIVRSCDLCSKLPEIRQERSGGGGGRGRHISCVHNERREMTGLRADEVTRQQQCHELFGLKARCLVFPLIVSK